MPTPSHRSNSSLPNYFFQRPSQSTHSHSQSHSRHRGRSRSRSRGRHHGEAEAGSTRGIGFFDTLSSISRGPRSSYKRRPRDGFIQSMFHKLRRALREALAYARRHPMKVLLPIIMALVSGGALTALLKTVGITLPASVSSLLGAGGGSGLSRGMKGGYDAWYSSQQTYEAGPGSSGGVAPGMIQGALKVASAFL